MRTEIEVTDAGTKKTNLLNNEELSMRMKLYLKFTMLPFFYILND